MCDNEVRHLWVEQLLSVTIPGPVQEGPLAPKVYLGSTVDELLSAMPSALSENLQIPDLGGGVYLAPSWGLQLTGGYSISVEAASFEANDVTVHLSLWQPFEDEFTTQQLNYPLAVALIRDLDLQGRSFNYVGRLRWQEVKA